jgi:two-component system OmpR family response regulator
VADWGRDCMTIPPATRARLLLVEDDAAFAESLIPALERRGFEVRWVADGLEGLDRARSEMWSAVILDLMLPTLPGDELLRRLREVSEVPVLVLTARRGLPDRVARLEEGADDYLTKPFELPELVARLKVLMRRSAGTAQGTLRLGSLEVDLDDRRVRRGGETVELSAAEYRLLELLLRQRGRYRSTDDLAELLSARGDRLTAVTVRTHVRNLRSKIGQDLLETRRGHGYRIPVAP